MVSGFTVRAIVYQLSSEGINIYKNKNHLNKIMDELFSAKDTHALKYDLFISYSTHDSLIAKELKEAIEKEGFTCFMAEKDIPTATLWENEIRNAIHLSKKILLLITPRSKNRPWILLETGAAWALQKDIIPALMFVTSDELVEPISKFQTRTIETTQQRDSLVKEITSEEPTNQATISGRWVDKADRDTVFFQQRGSKVIGIYDYDGRKSKVGYYIGLIKARTLDYEWRWYNDELKGRGKMTLWENKTSLSGQWWYDKDENSPEHVGYEYMGDEMPSWLTDEDFNELWLLHKKTE